MPPRWVAIQRVAWNIKSHIVWQTNGQIFFLLRHNTAAIAVYNWDRAAPIALPAQAPIAQAVLCFSQTQALCLGPINCGVYSLLASGLSQASRLANPAYFLRFRRNESYISYGCVIF